MKTNYISPEISPVRLEHRPLCNIGSGGEKEHGVADSHAFYGTFPWDYEEEEEEAD